MDLFFFSSRMSPGRAPPYTVFLRAGAAQFDLHAAHICFWALATQRELEVVPFARAFELFEFFMIAAINSPCSPRNCCSSPCGVEVGLDAVDIVPIRFNIVGAGLVARVLSTSVSFLYSRRAPV